MSSGASYEEVVRRGYIVARPDAPAPQPDQLAPLPRLHLAETARVREQEMVYLFHEQIVGLARRMAKVKVPNGKKKVNHQLKHVLIEAFNHVQVELLSTTDQIHSGPSRDKTPIFMLINPNAPSRRNLFIEKPHKSGIVLYHGQDGSLYVPVCLDPRGQNVTLIPYKITEESIENIDGDLGKKIKEAYHQGLKDLIARRTANRRIQILVEREADADQEIREFALPSPQPPTQPTGEQNVERSGMKATV